MIGIRSNSGNPLTREQQQQNAREIWGYFQQHGWTLESVSGMLGNMEVESYINPGQWENGLPYYQGGFGLVQWTPYTKFSTWAGNGWEVRYELQLDRIQYELENGLQWDPAGVGGMTFAEYTQSTSTPGELARLFFRGYERGTVYGQRSAYAAYWYEYLGGVGPLYPRVPIWLLFKLKGRYS